MAYVASNMPVRSTRANPLARIQAARNGFAHILLAGQDLWLGYDATKSFQRSALSLYSASRRPFCSKTAISPTRAIDG